MKNGRLNTSSIANSGFGVGRIGGAKNARNDKNASPATWVGCGMKNGRLNMPSEFDIS